MQHDENTRTRKDMALHRLQVAREDLETAQLLFKENKYRATNNRAYYAIYHAIDTVLSMYGDQLSTHATEHKIDNSHFSYKFSII